jgi:hypothetical protein
MKKKALTVVMFSMLFCASALSYAESTQIIQIAIFNPVQIFNEKTSITGLRVSIYGVNQNLSGVDWGLVNVLNGTMKGAQWGFFNRVKGDMFGYQDGFINFTEGNFTGWQSSLVNTTNGSFTGFQSGLVNFAENMGGLQLGLVNYTGKLHGFQVGIININNIGTPYKFLPIVNFSL